MLQMIKIYPSIVVCRALLQHIPLMRGGHLGDHLSHMKDASTMSVYPKGFWNSIDDVIQLTF